MKDVQIPIPEQIGPYRVLRPLAQGGMAAVFEVEDPHTRERLALKLLTHRGLAMPRFAREFRALTRLDHPNIVRVYRFGVHDSSPYLTMELLDGMPVQAYAKSVARPGRPKRTREVLRITALVADALDYLHQRGIVHRDLKSANILVLSDRRVKLLDFGTARILTNSDHITRHGEFVGTFAYASPEQITGGTVDPRSDLYSLGALLYRLCTGKRVFEAETPHKLARMHVNQEPKPPRELIPQLPEAVERLILRMLDKDPDRRPQSARAVADYIRGKNNTLVDRGGLVLGTSSRLAGRSAELAAVRAALDKGRPARMVLVSGPPGSGRGRLLRTAVAEARKKGWRVFDGNFAGLPGLGLLAELVERCWTSLPPRDRQELDKEIAALRKASEHSLGGGQLEPAQRHELVQAVTEILDARTRRDRSPVVFALFQLDRISPVALDVLAGVRRALRQQHVPVVFLGSCLDERDGRAAGLRQRLPDAFQLRLQPLTVAEVGEMVHHMLGGSTPSLELARKLHEVTGGLPGYVEEVMRAMVQGGLIEAHQDGASLTWVDKSEGRISVPASAKDAVRFRLDAVDTEDTRLLEALAVAGGTATAEVLAFALERELEETLQQLDELNLRGILRDTEENGAELWSFRLGMARDIVLEGLRASRRNVLRRKLARKVQDQGPSANKILLLAAAGRADEALHDVLAWGPPLLEWNRCLELLPVLEAVDKVLNKLETTPGADQASFQVMLGRCRAVLRPGDPRAAEAFEKARSLSSDPDVRGEVDLYAATLHLDKGQLSEARTCLERADGALAHSSRAVVKSRVARELGRLEWLQGRFGEAQGRFEEALETARREGDDREIARCLVARGATSHASGHLRQSERLLREAIGLYDACGDRDGGWHAQANLCELMRLSCRFSEAMRILEPELRVAHASGAIERWAFMTLNVAELEIEMLRLGKARERLAAIQAELDSGSHLHLRSAIAVARARIALASADHEDLPERTAPMIEACDRAGLSVPASLLRALTGEALVLTAREEEGVRHLDHALSRLRAARQVPALAEACMSRARAFLGREDPAIAFKPVLRWLEKEPALLVRMEYLQAAVRHAVLQGQRDRATAYLLACRELLGEVRNQLSEADRETLRVHPWNLFVRRGLNRAASTPSAR